VRRGFHTLKGSGRMVGLTDLGEVAWQCEQVMNKWLKEEKPATPDLLDFIALAERSFSEWIDRLKTGAETAIDGADGIQKVQGGGMSMVICDVNMPRMNGLEMIEAVQRGGTTVPIVMLTTEGQPGLIERAKKAGAKGWIIKPFKAELLVAAVQRLTA